jgi:hypothetical protein
MRPCLTATAVIPSDRRLYKVLHLRMEEKAAFTVVQVSLQIRLIESLQTVL